MLIQSTYLRPTNPILKNDSRHCDELSSFMLHQRRAKRQEALAKPHQRPSSSPKQSGGGANLNDLQ